MTRILVTGANGLLGQKLITLLSQQPAVFSIATTRRSFEFVPAPSVAILMDITDKESVRKAFDQHKPDVVIHAAAMTQVDQCEQQRDDCWKTNVEGTANVIAASEVHRCHLIYVSTDFVFSGERGPLVETDTPDPVNFYGESKLKAEQLVQASQCKWAILRTVLVYGVTRDASRSNIVLWVKNNLEQKKPIQVVNDQWRTPTLAEDLAMGCWLVANKRATGIYHISGSEMMTPYDIAIATAKFFGLDQSLISPTNASKFTQPAKRPAKTGFIVDKAVKELGYQPHKLVDGLAVLASAMHGSDGTN